MNELQKGRPSFQPCEKQRWLATIPKYQNNITGSSKTEVSVIPAANEHKCPLISVRLLCLNNPKCSRTRFQNHSHPGFKCALVWAHLCWCLWLCCCLNVAPHERDMTLKSRRIQKASWQEANAADRKWQTRIWLSSSLLPKNSTPPHVAVAFYWWMSMWEALLLTTSLFLWSCRC